MRFRSTLLWLVVAAALFAFIYFYQRNAKLRPAPQPGGFPGIVAAEVTRVELRAGNAPELRVVRTNSEWRMEAPLPWLAQATNVEALLIALEKAKPYDYITPEEVRARPNAAREYGLDDPKASILLQTPGLQHNLLVGASTSPGDQFFLRVVGREGVYVMSADLLKLIPSSPNQWRDRAVVDLNRLPFDKVTVNNGQVFTIERDSSRNWRMTHPMRSRADQARIHEALEKIHSLRILDFVTDDPQAELDAYGLQPPRLSLTLTGTNMEPVTLQFGKDTNSNQVFARRTNWNSVVTVPKEFVTDWLASIKEFRDPYIFTIKDPILKITVSGATPFTVEGTTNDWKILPSNWPGDPDLIREFIVVLNGLKVVQFTRDVVTAPDLPQYGLENPTNRYEVITQAEGKAPAKFELQLGSTQDDNIFARRSDEDSIYALNADHVRLLPTAPWQLRLRKLWNMDLNDVTSVTTASEGRQRQVVNKGEGRWGFGPGSEGVMNELAVQETIRGLCTASVDRWAGVGTAELSKFGIGEKSFQVAMELRNGKTILIRFGNSTASQGAFAAIDLDGQAWIGEFPWILCRDIVTYLAPPAPPSQPPQR